MVWKGHQRVAALTWKTEIVNVSGVRLGRCHGEVAEGAAVCQGSELGALAEQGAGVQAGQRGALSLGPSSSQAGLIRFFK